MATEVPKVSGQPGEVELPTPSFSEPDVSQKSTDADEIVSKLTPILEQLVERKVQSTKDKRLSKIEKALGGRLDLLAELEEAGVEIPKETRTEMRLRELEEQRTQSSTQPAPVRVDGSTQQKAAVTEAIAELNKYGLSSDDADFLNLLRGQYSNRAAFDLEVQRHIVKKIAPPKPANPADVVQSPATGKADSGDLMVEYQNRAQKVRGNALIELKMEYRKKGLDIN